MIRALHEQLKNKEVSAVELAERYLMSVKENDGDLGAYLTVLPEEALREARFVDEKIARGEEIDLLAGIPGAIKDNMCMEGTRTTAASKILDNYIAPYDATAVERLKHAGAVILGKTNMDEFAMGASTETSAYRQTKNPVDPTRVPGGSSGGSAVAVAGEMAVWALGSDTGGSIRQPASFCGVVGLKPTYGRVSRYGLLAMASSFDQIGPLAHSVEDTAIVFSRIYGYDPMDMTTAESEAKRFEDFLGRTDLQGLRIGLPKEYFSEDLDDRVRKVSDAAVERFKSLGAEIVDISLSYAKYALPAYYIIVPSEVSSNLARFDGIKYGLRADDKKEREPGTGTLLETYLDTRGYGFGAEVKRRIMLGTYTLSAGYYDAYYKKAQAVRKLIKRDFSEAFKKVDLIFSPTAPEPAFKFGAKSDPLSMYLSDIYTVPAPLAGLPAISFPIGTIEEAGKQLPLGGQLMAKWFDEETLFCAADAYEKSANK